MGGPPPKTGPETHFWGHFGPSSGLKQIWGPKGAPGGYFWGSPPKTAPRTPLLGGVPPTPKFGSPGTPESPKFGVGGSPPRIRGFGGVPPQIPEFPGFSCFRLNQRSAQTLPNSPPFRAAPRKFPVGRVFQPRGSAALSTMCRDILHLRIKMRRVSEKSFRLQTCVPHSPSEGQGLPIQGWFASRLNISNPRSNSKNDGKKCKSTQFGLHMWLLDTMRCRRPSLYW